MATLIDNNSESLYYDYWYLGVYDPGEDCYPEMGQSFVAIDTYTELDSAKFYLTSYGTPPVGNIYSKIYASTGTHGVDALPTGSALATSDPVDSSLVTNTHPTYELYTFTFSGANRINLTSGTTYIIVVEYTEALTYANGIWAGFTDLQHAGNAASLFATWEVGGPWGSTNEDLIFYIYGTEYVPPVVDLPTYDRTSLEKGRFLQPIDINNLEEVSFIAGNTYHLDFPAYDENGNGLDISTGSCRWALSPYGEPNVVILQKEGVFTSTGSFRITLDAEDTRNLSGKFMHQASLRDWNGKRFIPSQGVITIVSSIPFEKASPEIYYVFPIADVGVRTANVAVWGENSIILVLIPDAVGYEVTYTVIIDGVTYTYTFTNAGDGVFYLLNPPNGDGTITVDGDYFWGAIVLYDVNQDYPFTIWDTINGDIIDTIIGDIVIDAITGEEGDCTDPLTFNFYNSPTALFSSGSFDYSAYSPYLSTYLAIHSSGDVIVAKSPNVEDWTGYPASYNSGGHDTSPYADGNLLWIPSLNKFILGGNSDYSYYYTDSGLYLSSNGTTWDYVPWATSLYSSYITSIAYNPTSGLIVAAGFAVHPTYAYQALFTLTSTNGVNWTKTELYYDVVAGGTHTEKMYSMCYSSKFNKFYAIKSVYPLGEGWQGEFVMSSPDGITWTELHEIYYGGNIPDPEMGTSWDDKRWFPEVELFVMSRDNPTWAIQELAQNIATSPNGIDWTMRDTPIGYVYSLIYGDGLMLGVSCFGLTNQILSIIFSEDGINWEQIILDGILDVLEGISYSDDLKVFVATVWDEVNSAWKFMVIQKCVTSGSGTELSTNSNGSIQATTATSGTTTSSWGTTGTRIVITVHPI